MIDKVKAKKRPSGTDAPNHADVAKTAERQQASDQPDPFPEEGTDEKAVQGAKAGQPLSDDEAVTATKAVIGGEDPAALSNSDVSEAVRRRGLTGGDDNVLSPDTQETTPMITANPTTANPTATATQGTVLKNVPFAEHLNKLPEPVKDFIHRRPGAAMGIAALAGLALLVARPIRR